ncbi:diguanylate cyclase [Pantoea allii]|uniref:sensor domain-containing diguanylate cyclase n=1 Tax=Pantoea allii TaxID=574096 RepID=UPI0024B7D172|nr:diguanylate cyclase [Pantoea allii]MDJ0035373.1 diguanylate cyclase [Pantoea allii]
MELRRKKDVAMMRISPLLRSITLAGSLLTIGVIVVNVWTLHLDWQRTVRLAEERAIDLSLAQARQAEDTFLQTELSLREVQREIESQTEAGVDVSAINNIMRTLQSRLPQLDGIFYYDAQGKWIASSLTQTPSANNADREYFAYHRNNPRNSVHVGPALRSRSSERYVIPVSLRVSDNYGDFRSVLLATVSVDYFRHYYDYFVIGPKDLLALMLADSTVLYARPLPDSYIGKNLSSSPLFHQLLENSQRGSGQWKAEVDGITRIFGFASSSRYPFVVAAGFDKQGLFVHWAESRVQGVVLSLVLLMAIILLWMLMRHEARRSLRYQIELTHLRDELTAANHSLENLANADGLTGLANRRYFDHFLKKSLLHGRSSGGPVSLILFDIDYFKRYNDTYGHVAGDACLQQVGRVLKTFAQRRTDIAARYGGEEFAIVLADTRAEDALRMALSVVEAVRALAIPHTSTGLETGCVTLSAGVASSAPGEGPESAGLLIKRADEALYRVKHQGRNGASI